MQMLEDVFAHRIVKLWNSLPVDIVEFGSCARFRSSLRRIDFRSFLVVD